ncbi:MAG: hypothetical protein Q9190_001357 [Brigantiaea leucoxantha]
MRAPNYCASKEALHYWILVLRHRLKDSNIKVVELYPPDIQTELRDERHQPDIKNGRQIGMPLDQFTNGAYAGLAAGGDEVLVAQSGEWSDNAALLKERQQVFDEFTRTQTDE